MNADVYWRMPYTALASSRALTEYVVLDIEEAGTSGRGDYANLGQGSYGGSSQGTTGR